MGAQVCLLRKQRTTSCEREHDWRALPSTHALLPSFNPILLSHKRQLLHRHARCPCITFVVAAQQILLALNASLSRVIENVIRIS